MAPAGCFELWQLQLKVRKKGAGKGPPLPRAQNSIMAVLQALTGHMDQRFDYNKGKPRRRVQLTVCINLAALLKLCIAISLPKGRLAKVSPKVTLWALRSGYLPVSNLHTFLQLSHIKS